MHHMLSYSNNHLTTAPCLQRHIPPSVNTLSLLRQSRYRVTASLQDVLPDREESEQPIPLKSSSDTGFTDAICVVGFERKGQDCR